MRADLGRPDSQFATRRADISAVTLGGIDMNVVCLVIGTRPEGIKLAPVAHSLERSATLRPFLLDTGQHPDLVTPTLAGFGLSADRCFPALTCTTLPLRLAELVSRVGQVLDETRPRIVLVQGDTLSALAGGLAAFLLGIPVGHVEAGLRTPSIDEPFPEEANRRLVTQITKLHFGATKRNCDQLLQEGVDPTRVFEVGNTVIDALRFTLEQAKPWNDPAYACVDEWSGPVVLLTAHRRESWGEGLDRVADAIEQLVASVPSLLVVAPLHPNPVVRASFSRLERYSNVRITGPASYPDTTRLLARATLAITDSGGLQEEAPAVATPVLVARNTTERLEAIEAGTALLVGTDTSRIVTEAYRILGDPAAQSAMVGAHKNLYGDGFTSDRIVDLLARYVEEITE
jgi:UDP-N-acetylglucosamine 2-epimerase (non-hydrolysing)